MKRHTANPNPGHKPAAPRKPERLDKPAKSERPYTSRILSSLLFLGLGLLASSLFLHTFSPRPYIPPPEPFRDYDHSAMQKQMRSEAVAHTLTRITNLGSRSPGQKGHEATADLIAKSFSAAGLEVIEQFVDVVHPTASVATLTSGPEHLDVFPFYPNHVQPMVTGPEGLRGELFLVSDDTLAEAYDFHDKIALIDLSAPAPETLNLTASRYAALGFKALIVAHRDGLEHINWSALEDLTIQLPVNFVRVAADKEIFALAGQDVNLTVQTRFKTPRVRNIIGLLKAGRGNGEALIIPVNYDGFSALPDLNHGSHSALQLAIQQQLLAGLLPYKDSLRRDVLFVATGGDFQAQSSLNSLLSALGTYQQAAERLPALEAELEDHNKQLAILTSLQPLFDSPNFCRESSDTTQALNALPPDAREHFDTQLRYVLKYRVLELGENLLQKKIQFERIGGTDLTQPEYTAFMAAKKTYDRANTAVSFPIGRYLNEHTAHAFDLRHTLQARLQELAQFHKYRIQRLQSDVALNQLFGHYSSLSILAPALNPGAAGREVLSFSSGREIEHGDQALVFKHLLENAVQELDLSRQVSILFKGQKQAAAMANATAQLPLQSTLWSTLSYPAFSLVNPESDYETYYTPTPLALGKQIQNLAGSLATLGELVLSTAYGNGRFTAAKYNRPPSFHGSVLASGVGNAVVPNFPVAHALVFDRQLPKANGQLANKRGYQRMLLPTDPYGQYALPHCAGVFGDRWIISPEAVRYNDQGLIDFYKDQGDTAQKIYKSVSISGQKMSGPINLVLFRSSAVAILDRTNPQTLKEYSRAVFLRKQGLQPFASSCPNVSQDGFIDFIRPDETFFVVLKAGAAGHEAVQETRAFMLGIPEGYIGDRDKDIDGKGYLVQDHSILYNVPGEVAASMAYLNEKRLVLQKQYGMADDMTLRFQAAADAALEAGRADDTPALERARQSATSVTYSTLNHPVIRTSISEAIWGILWYMGLLVPFVFFAEKLLFASTDIRKALGIQAGIFLLVFTLLRILHPAFEMIRSSVMILLGFVILLIASGITLILSGKFRENLDALRQVHRRVKGAEGHKLGIIITAFMLGLNNMHRRKVRTGLTCASLVLLTFVMICFTSVQSNVVDSSIAMAKSPYQGLLIKNPGFAPISDGEVSALNSRYGHQYEVVRRSAFVGMKTWHSSELLAPEIEVVSGTGASARSTILKSALLFNRNEPLQDRLHILAGAHWFTDELVGPDALPPVIISDTTAEKLGLSPARINEAGVPVRINGTPCQVVSIFDAQELSQLLDLDGDNLLPFDVEGMINPKGSGGGILAEKNDMRVAATDLLIALDNHFPVPVQAGSHLLTPRILSAVVVLGDTPFKTARKEIDRYLEQTGKATSYGLDGMAYLGKRAREKSVTGLIDMLIPLLIGGLTVLNTMKGSVYERKKEIFVYNAVGIAPRYVFFMFMAEAVVYAVIGSLLGYILSQGTGRILTELGWTGGLNLNFTSLASVYASLTITAAVFLSTWFPAHSAMVMASPAEDSGWALPEASENTLSFELPFTFTHRDRIAVLAFFHTYLMNHGEGSAGSFYADTPTLGVSDQLDELADGAYIPTVSAMTWLKPFDLGVSQRLDIELATDRDTREYISRVNLTRLSGSRTSWLRLNTQFIARLRQHFLLWRAVPEEMKATLFEEAKTRLHDMANAGEHPHG